MARQIRSSVRVLSAEERAARLEEEKAREAAAAASVPSSPFTSAPLARMWRLNPECRFWHVPA